MNKIYTRTRLLFVFHVSEKGNLHYKFFFFNTKFTYVNLSMSALCLHKMLLPQVYCHHLALDFLKSRSINYFLEKFFNVLLVYKEREMIFFLSSLGRSDSLYMCNKWNPFIVFYLFALPKNSMGLLLSH